MLQAELVECPRDAIQGWPRPIATSDKIAYYRTLLDVGFTCLDLGSFVSHKAVPQMADTRLVVQTLYDEGKFNGLTDALVIVANERGAKDAIATPGISFVGFPMSLSETFQLKNTGASCSAALIRLENIRSILSPTKIQLVVYLSMGFGNPYGDEWSPSLLMDWIGTAYERIDPSVIALSDTVGNASPQTIEDAFKMAYGAFPKARLGAHLHATPWEIDEKIQAAWRAGCRRFDGALRGIGGCPMAQDELVGNLPTEKLLDYFLEKQAFSVNERAWNQAQSLAVDLFA